MDLSQAPAFVAVKLAMLSDACATATMRADELTAQIADLRDRLKRRSSARRPSGEAAHRARAAARGQKGLQRQRPIEADMLGRCRAWLADLPPGAVLEQIIPDGEAGLSLSEVRPVSRNSRIESTR